MTGNLGVTSPSAEMSYTELGERFIDGIDRLQLDVGIARLRNVLRVRPRNRWQHWGVITSIQIPWRKTRS
jgi:hypothetical protein